MSMVQQQRTNTTSSWAVYYILVFLGIVIGTALLEAAATFIAIVMHLLSLPQIIFTWALPASACAVLDLGVATLFIWTAESRAIRAYIRTMQAEQAKYSRIYTSLSVLSDVYKTSLVSRTDPTHTPQDLQEVLQQHDSHLLLLGLPGAGKTTALLVCQYNALKLSKDLLQGNERMPVFISMNDYNAFLKDCTWSTEDPLQEPPSDAVGLVPPVGLLDYLFDLESIHRLRPYLRNWVEHGRILFLCDGINEIDGSYMPAVCQELTELMQNSRNRIVVTCRELDYTEQEDVLGTLVSDGQAIEKLILPLKPRQVEDFITQYITHGYADGKSEPWICTAKEVIDLLKNTDLQHECTNPLMLYMLMQTINSIGTEKGKEIDTRGLLLRAFVLQLIQRERERSRGQKFAFTEDDLITFLSQVAWTARRKKYRNALPLDGSHTSGSSSRRKRTYQELADILHLMLVDEAGPTADVKIDPASLPGPPADLKIAKSRMIAKMLAFAAKAALIDIDPENRLHFRHELVAEYFVAEYLYKRDIALGQVTIPFGDKLIGDELITTVGDWNEPIRIWAGFLPDPMQLAERIGNLKPANLDQAYNALTLGMMCVGVKWQHPHATSMPVRWEDALPMELGELLVSFISDETKRDRLAHTFNRCAQEGGVSVYRPLLHLVRYQGIDELLLKLDQKVVSELLFEHLSDIVDKDAYEQDVQHLQRILGNFGSVIVLEAIELSKPADTTSPTKAIRFRRAAINILGRIQDQRVIEPLIGYLHEDEMGGETVQAFKRLGPRLSLIPVLQALAYPYSSPSHTEATHRAVIAILGNFLQLSPTQLGSAQHKRIIEALLQTLSSDYPSVQLEARSLLQREAQPNKPRREAVIDSLIRSLASSNTAALHSKEILRQLGSPIIPLLRKYLDPKQASDVIRAQIVEVFGMIDDPQVLSDLATHIASPWPNVRQQVAKTLQKQSFVPYSVPILIKLVLSPQNSEEEAAIAADILKDIGRSCVEKIIESLLHIVPGRTHILVQVLERVGDPQAVMPLIQLLPDAQNDLSLTLAIIQALGTLQDERAAEPLLTLLATSQSPLYEKICEVLSLFGEKAISPFISALDSEQETATTRGIYSALLQMKPFPNQSLLTTFAQCNDAQARHIMKVFQRRGDLDAPLLVSHLCDANKRIQDYVRQTLEMMEGHQIIQALLDSLNHPTCRPLIVSYLKKYPQMSIPKLVGMLGDTQLGESATLTLVDFGPDVIRPLLPGLNDQKSSAQRRAQEVIEKLVRQQVEVLPSVIGLFRELRLPADERAHETLVGVLINHLADVSLQPLLEGMESEHLQVRDGVTQALVRLVRKDNAHSDVVFQELLKALFREERRPQGASALEQIGEKAVKGVGELAVDNDPAVRQIAWRILSNIGKPALPWAYKNKNDLDPLRREAGETVIRNMRAPAIIDYLVDLLAGEGQQVEEVLGILLERVRSDQKIIPVLLEYIQTHPRDSVTVRIVTILLLLPRNIVLDYLDQALANNPDPQKWLAPTFLLLGMRGGEAKAILLKMAQNPQTSHKLLAEIIGILGMLEVHPLVELYASTVGTPLSRQIRPQQYIELAQRAIGGLLVSGGWNSQELRAKQQKATAENELIKHELYTVLLGESYIPHIAELTKQLADERYAYAEDSRQSQEKIRELNSALTGVKVDLATKKGELTKKENELQRLNDLLNTANQQIGQLQAANSNLKGQIKHLQQPPQKGW
jgi:HEAT repeat protein